MNSVLGNVLDFGSSLNMDPVVSAIDKSGSQSVENTAQVVDGLRGLAKRLDRIDERLARQEQREARRLARMPVT